MAIEFVAQAKLPTRFGLFTIAGFKETLSHTLYKEHVAIYMGDFSPNQPVLARIHSECLTGDALFSERCDCGMQLNAALQKIAAEKNGIVLYLRQEGRGIGLLNKIKAYALQDQGLDTVEANEQLGFKADQREYQICQEMFNHFKINKIRLLTNNPKKIESLEIQGIDVVERIPLEITKNKYNESYLAIKKSKLGHLLSIFEN